MANFMPHLNHYIWKKNSSCTSVYFYIEKCLYQLSKINWKKIPTRCQSLNFILYLWNSQEENEICLLWLDPLQTPISISAQLSWNNNSGKRAMLMEDFTLNKNPFPHCIFGWTDKLKNTENYKLLQKTQAMSMW